MSAFSSINNPETITAICVGIATILGAIATFLKKLKGKTWKELLTNLNKEEFKIISKVVEEQGKIIQEAINKEKDKSNSKKDNI